MGSFGQKDGTQWGTDDRELVAGQRSSSPPTSDPHGCNILLEGTSPIIAEYVSFLFWLDNIPDLLIEYHDDSIVFVHGLRGHPTNTWTKDKICWPKDFT